MVKIIMHGCNGHMGQVISTLVEQDADTEIVAGIDMLDNRTNSYPVFTSLQDCNVEADVMIDFSSFKATDGVLAYCTEKKLPLVLCTTGLTAEQLEKVNEACRDGGSALGEHVSWYQYPAEASAGRGKGAGFCRF